MMSYVVRKDGQGWRAVRSAEDIDTETEIWQAEQPAIVEPPEQLEWLLQRVASYPKVGDALNALFDAMKAGVISKVEPWYNQCEAVKEAFPKQ
jgi:hypothetical protein